MDFIWIFDLSGNALASFGPRYSPDSFTPYNSNYFNGIIAYNNQQRRIRKNIFLYNQTFYAGLIFPIYENARKIAVVVYGKSLADLVNDLSNNTKTIAFVRNREKNTLYKTIDFDIPIDSKETAGDFFSHLYPSLAKFEFTKSLFKNIGSYDSNFIKYDNQYYRSTNLDINADFDIGKIFLLTNATKDRQYQIDYLTAITIMILGLAFSASVIINALLRRRFKPLDRAIDVLGALSRGDTTVDIKSTSKDEVGRIATAVSSFRTSLIEREKIRGLFG